MLILVVFKSFYVVKYLEKPDPVCAKRPHLSLLQQTFPEKKKNEQSPCEIIIPSDET